MNLQGGHPREYFSRRRSLNELLHSKGDDSGYVEGKVFMIWPPRNRLHRVNLEVAEDSALYRFELEVPHRDGIAFRPHDRVCVALKGMKVIQRKESSAPHYFPIVLRFPDGVVLKYLSGANAGRVVDTWEGNTDEWYNPGKVHIISDAVTLDASEVRPGRVPTVTCPSMSIISRTDVPDCSYHSQDVIADQPPPPLNSIADCTTVAQLIRPAQQPSTERPGRSSKARLRKKRRLLKEKARETMSPNQLATETDKPLPVDVIMPCHEQPQTSIYTSLASVSCSHPQPHQIGGHVNREISISEVNGMGISDEDRRVSTVVPPEEFGIPALQLKAGMRTQRGDIFTPLKDIQKGHSMINVIGIVAHVTPGRKTATNEWCRSITLVDPSIFDSSQRSIKVNCFQKKYLEWLPQVQKGDIVILRKLKAVKFNGDVTATGYGDKLRWAVYDPFKHSMRPPQKGNAPEKELTDDGMGYEYSPYWEPFQDSTEIEYCRKIAEWWEAMGNLEGQKVVAVECSKPCKQHLLISEASPDLPPRGFFNCTVEVLQKFDNPCGATTIYVTDYTANALVHSVQATWCPPQLSDRVLQCNMWDNAKNIALMMNPGEYWYLYNLRARWNPNHCMEGTMRLAEKVTQLDENKLEAQPHLRALLARKKGFELNHVGLTLASALMHVFPDMLLQDVEESTSFCTCIVELLHMDLNSRDGHFLYATDYTYNPDLPSIVSTADWARSLEHRVVKIKLDDIQSKVSSNLTPGSVYIVQNMRIKRSSISSGMHGCLGGDDTLIVCINDLSSPRAEEFQRNKEKWKRENMLNVPSMPSNRLHRETDALPNQAIPLGSTISQGGLVFPAPIELKVTARVVDFFPFSLEDACVLRCTNCGSSPPSSFQRCPRCDDMMETHCKWFYCLYIILQDAQNNEVIVSLSAKECTLLKDVDPTDFHRDQAAFHKFLAKLDPILGNLRDVHLAWSRNEDKAIESPPVIFTIESWNIGSGRGYGLLDYTTT